PVILATELNPGPVITDPGQAASTDRSPVVLRVDFSGAVDPSLLVAGSTVQLTDANANPVLFATHYSPDTNQLELSLAAPLAPGTYTLSVQGFSALGQSGDYSASFTVTGIEGAAAADDTAATAHALGDITGGGLVSVNGFIGDDPYYSFFTDPSAPLTFSDNYAGADVDMYRFTVTGPGTYAFLAEVDAGRIGSPLDPGVSLFRLEADGLHLVAVNDNGNNGAVSNVDPLTGSVFTPLQNDAALYAGLTEGTYVLAVSSGYNTPDPVQGRQVGLDPSDPNYDPNNSVFDPNRSHSGQAGPGDCNGFTTGAYVLNLRVLPAGDAPRVVAVTPAEGSGPLAPPSQITVQFSKPVNVAQLAYQSYGLASVDRLDAVYVVGPNGRDYYPRLQSWDAATNTATFLLLDALPTGANELHLSGALGLTDYAGNPLAGNDPSGDYVVHFRVCDPLHPDPGTPLNLTDQEPNNNYLQAQQLGSLFSATDLQQGVTITRDLSANPQAAAQDAGTDCYQFTVSQARQYFFTLTGSGMPAGTAPLILDALGNPVLTTRTTVGSGVAVLAQLAAGQTYYVCVGGWAPAQAAGVQYQLRISIGNAPENPTPLSFGSAPLVSIRPVNSAPPPPVSLPVPPGSTSPTTPALFRGTGSVFLANAFLPGSSLLAGPVGGLPAVGGGGQTVTLASLPSLELAFGETGLMVLASTLLTSTGDDPAEHPLSGPISWGDEWPAEVRQALDLLFRMTDWLQVLPTDPDPAPGAGPADAAPEEEGPGEAAAWGADGTTADAGGPGHAEGGGWSWAAAAAAVALRAGPALRRR
ncbi:MAG TPA: DVUA0089 family protein, partial [Gemmataceae bacterium]|nr:DVUA0089 family protein [Gemmataceae bacterium]